MLCVTSGYVRDITDTFSPVLPLNTRHLVICPCFPYSSQAFHCIEMYTWAASFPQKWRSQKSKSRLGTVLTILIKIGHGRSCSAKIVMNILNSLQKRTLHTTSSTVVPQRDLPSSPPPPRMSLSPGVKRLTHNSAATWACRELLCDWRFANMLTSHHGRRQWRHLLDPAAARRWFGQGHGVHDEGRRDSGGLSGWV